MEWPSLDGEMFRIQALEALMLLDTTPEERFDRVVKFACDKLNVPISLITLVDGHRQWFKAKVGLHVSETPRDIAFCGYAIASDEIFVVEDAKQDERFKSNPLVTGEPHIRFYAGAPISSPSGYRVGTLCVIDTYPRSFKKLDRALLNALRHLLNDMLAGKEVATLPVSRHGS